MSCSISHGRKRAAYIEQEAPDIDFASLENPDVLDNFDIDSFLQSGGDKSVDFDPVGFSFANPEGKSALCFE